MKRSYVIIVFIATMSLAVVVPTVTAATAYKVSTKGGRVVGSVRPGPLPSGADRIGIVRDLHKYRGAVYSRQNSSGYWGWPVSNTSTYVAWVRKASDRRFLIKKVPWGAAVGRAVKTSNGRWLSQKKSSGRWRTIGRVQKGCPGRWAAGSARLLLWSR